MNREFKKLVAGMFSVALISGPVLSASAGAYVYVPLGSAGEVVIVDTELDSVIGTIPGLPAVHGLAGSPDGRYLIAGSYEERDVCCDLPEKPDAVSEDDHAAHHEAPDDGIEAPASVVSTLSIVDIVDRSVMRRIDVHGAVHHVTVSPDGQIAVVTHPNQDMISAIDLDSFKVVATVATGPLPNYAVFSPQGDWLYVSNAGNGTVSAVDSERWIVRWNAIVGGSPEHVVLSSDGSTLYVNNVDDGTVSVVGTVDGSTVQTIPIGSTLHGIDLSDDDMTLFVADLGNDKIVGIDLASGAQRSAILTPAPYHLAAVNGTDKLYVSSADEPNIWIVDQTSLSIVGEIPIGGKGHQMVQGPGA